MTGPAVPGRPVIELDSGITAYPARFDGNRWRAVGYEDGERQECESVQEATLAAKLEKVKKRLAADAPNMKRPGADLIAHYLDPTGSRRIGAGPASTRTPSVGCASGSPPRSSTRLPARTSRPATRSGWSTPRPRPGKATGFTG